MRGFFFSSLFFISLMLTLVVISQLFGQLEMPGHGESLTPKAAYGFALSSLKGVRVGSCYIDINTFGRLDTLDVPEEVPC